MLKERFQVVPDPNLINIVTISWVDKSLGDLSDKITTGPNSRQWVFRIIFIIENEISGYHSNDTLEDYPIHILNYSYDSTTGTHIIEFYTSLSYFATASDNYKGRIQIRYLDGKTPFTDLDAFDLVDVNDGVLSKPSSVRELMYYVWGGDVYLKAYYS